MDDVRLIDANRLLEVCKEAYHYEDSRGKLGYCIDAIKHAPTIDAQPVKHGRWIKGMLDGEGYHCSECRIWKKHIATAYYCQNCGAIMVGGDDHVGKDA